MEPSPLNKNTPSLSGGFTLQAQSVNEQSRVAPRSDSSSPYIPAGTSAEFDLPGKQLKQRYSQHACNHSEQPVYNQNKELLRLALLSNHPATQAAIKACETEAAAFRGKGSKYRFTASTEAEQLRGLKQKLNHLQSETPVPEVNYCHAYDPNRNSFGTPVDYKLTINGEKQTLTDQQRLRLANDVLLDEISDQLKSISKSSQASKWKGDLERSDIVLQVEVQDSCVDDRWILPIHSVNPNRKSNQIVSDKKSTTPVKTVEQKEKELIDKLERTIPGSVPVLQDALRQDVLNPIYLFIADELGITPKPSSQVYSVEVTAINQDEFKVESKARFTRYTKPGVNKSNEGETTIHVQSHFKRDNGAFVPSWLSTDIQLNGIKAKHLKTQPKMKRAKSADALREVKGNLISSLSPQRPASTVMADSLLRWNEGIFCGATSLNGSKATRPASHFFPFTPVERQISQQRGATQKLTLTQVDGQLYATNMPQTELEQRIQEKTTIRDYKKSLHEAQKVWDSPPRASSMSIPHPLNQTSAQLSKLITNRPTPDFFEQNKKGIIASTPGTITTMKQADLAYKNLWLNKANELSQGSSDHAYHLVIHSLPSLTLQGEKVAQFVELSSKLKIMSNAMVKLSEEAREAKEVFSRKAINQKQLLGWLLKIKTESSEQLKKLRGSGCEFSTLCEQYGFYKNQSPVDGYQNAAQYLEEQKKRVILEEKKLMAAVMIATIESKDTVPGSDTLPGYDDYAKFINDMAVYDKNGSATPLVSHMLGNSKRFNGYKLFDNEGNFRLPEQLVKEVEAQAIEKLVKEVEAQAIEKLAMYGTKNPEAKTCKGWRV